ncbi:META domain-containing protein [Mesorhizobium sp. M0051]|uniref:META domain-containing protein n=1 Tax=unclassified Mesorhizobium TaxID=325217 RepID=UPI0004197A5A|nr:META domain-containing protein [Mesorhizobium sp. LNHC252B00]
MLDRIAEFFVFGFVPLVVGMLAVPGPSVAAGKTVRGEVIYRERIALLPSAVLSVQLADVSRADAPTDAPQTIMLKMVTPSAEPTGSVLDQLWLVDYVDGMGASTAPQATFSVSEAGKAGGKGPCNTYFATAKIDGRTIAISDIGSTYKACAPEVMAEEKALFDALAKAASYNVAAGKLIIADKDGREILRFSAAS